MRRQRPFAEPLERVSTGVVKVPKVGGEARVVERRSGRRGITAYLSNGGTLEHAQRIAEHASPKTTKLYDRTADTVPPDEIDRIVI